MVGKDNSRNIVDKVSSVVSAGRLVFCVDAWSKITSDAIILEAVRGLRIDHADFPPQSSYPRDINRSFEQNILIDKEMQSLLNKKVITPAVHSPGEFLSSIFSVPKREGKLRLILNLKEFNHFIPYIHFKMETFAQALCLIKPFCYMASIDLYDAYYSVSINAMDRKFFRFRWKDQLYEFTCMPNGLACAPRIFTKILKPVFSCLRQQGLCSVYYLDDSLLFGSTVESCLYNVNETTNLLSSLGFTINEDKSQLAPTQCIEFLGFIIDSRTMLVTLPKRKIVNIQQSGQELLCKGSLNIRRVASFIGLLVSSFPAVKFGPLYYRQLELAKCHALRLHNGNFSASMILSDAALDEVRWWVANVHNASKPIHVTPPSVLMQTDASKKGWGAVLSSTTTGGQWKSEELDCHINLLEIKAVFFGLESLCKDVKDTHIRIQIDNVTAVAYINNMGGTKSWKCNGLVKEIWTWARDNNNHVSAEHLPGSRNVVADRASRVFHDGTEWTLDPKCFEYIVNFFREPCIDLFASRLNHKCPDYISWKPDPGALYTNAFSISWADKFFYAFPPFTLINLCLQKICCDKAEGIIVIPLWSSQIWFPRLLQMLVAPPLVMPLDVLRLPYKDGPHPLHKTLRLMACHVSGISIYAEEFRLQQQISSWPLGGQVQNINISVILESGILSVIRGRMIPCQVMKI